MSFLTLRHIEVFHAVYRYGSISAAARALGVSQPAASKVLHHAESRIGFPLFRLEKGRLRPTSEADALFSEARDLHLRVESLQNTALNLKRGGEGHLRVAMLHALGLQVVPNAINHFLARFPDVSIDLRTLHGPELLLAVRERSCDVGIGFDLPGGPDVEHVQVGAGELVALFGRADARIAADRVSLSEFQHLDFIRITNDGTLGALLDHAIGAAGDGWSRLTAQTYFVAAELVNAGLGYTVVDEFTARGKVTADTDFRPLAEPVRFDVVASFLADRSASPLLKNFLASVRVTLASLKP